MLAIYIGSSVDEGINSRPPFWVSHWLGSCHWGSANWLFPLALCPRCLLVAFPFWQLSAPHPPLVFLFIMSYFCSLYFYYYYMVFPSTQWIVNVVHEMTSHDQGHVNLLVSKVTTNTFPLLFIIPLILFSILASTTLLYAS
jgi:hypothetical protein